jgi:hypothetical protein
MKFHSIAALGLLSLSAFAGENPKQGRETYFGTGYTERAPEYGEVFFTFKTDCQQNEKAVREALKAKIDPIWNAINKKVTTYSETDRKYWGDVKDINGKPDSVIPPREDGNKKTSEKAKRFSVCNDIELPIESPVGLIYSGNQKIGVRSSDLDWLEGVEKAVLALPQGKLKTEVEYSTSKIKYGVTERTADQMAVEVRRQARNLATGPGSLFESDRKALRFESAHLIASRVQYSPLQNALMGSPIEKGKAPKVSLSLPFVYTIYAEGTDLIDPSNRRGSSGLQAEYQAQGTAVTEADYGRVAIVVSKGCLTKPENAGDSISALSEAINGKLEKFQNKKSRTESDRYTMRNLQVFEDLSVYTAVKWREPGDNPNLALSFFDACSGKTVDAPKNGQVSGLPKYYVAKQEFELRSSDFASLIGEVEKLQDENSTRAASATDARVVVGDAIGQVTKATLSKLLLKARESASACVLDPKGALSDDAQRFQCAHLKSIRIEGAFGGRGRGLEEGAGLLSASPKADFGGAPGGAPGGNELPIVTETRDGETRPRMIKEATFAFDYQFVTADYVPSFKTPALP